MISSKSTAQSRCSVQLDRPVLRMVTNRAVAETRGEAQPQPGGRDRSLCGIAGFTQKSWSPDGERIRAATWTLSHRGPDQQGVFVSPLCSLGATRLKILDLHAGDQPMQSESGDTVLVFNGEIYNHLDVRRRLESLGHRFVTHCDTETVLHAYLEWDLECFSHLRGMFALALWTRSKRRLVLARDRVGIKPLYFARHGDDLLFGSELKAILVHPELERRLSREGLDCYLALNYVPCPWTLVDGIEKLPPGHWLEWRDGEVSTGCYWSLPAPAIGPRMTPQSAEEELHYLLQQSVGEHLLSDVPLGLWLSGGIDSTTILHYAATASSQRLKTFSVSFRGRSFDETSYIRLAAERYGTEHQEIDLHPGENLEGAIEEFAYYSDEPSADAGALPVWFLSKLCKTQTTVALSGEGADEIFAGYLTYRADQLARPLRALPRGALRLALRAVSGWPVSNDKISFEYKLKRLLEGALMPPARAHVYWNGTFSDAEKFRLLPDPLPASLAQNLSALRAALLTHSAGEQERLGAYLHYDQRYYLPDDILVKSDRMSMAHAVEVRPPFLDHRILEFAATLPPELKMRGSQQKVLLKQLMQSKLPPEILRRKKIGFDIPAHDWLRGPLRALVTDTLTEAAAAHGDLFSPQVIGRCLRLHMGRKLNLGYHLWGLMILFLWMKRWQIQSTPSSSARTRAFAAEGAGTYT